MTTLTRTDRELIAAAHRWGRKNGWRVGFMGWGNDRTRVEWDDGVVRIWRKSGEFWPIFAVPYPVDSVRQGVDLLCALGILPAKLSSAYWVGLESVEEWFPFPLASYSTYLRVFPEVAVAS